MLLSGAAKLRHTRQAGCKQRRSVSCSIVASRFASLSLVNLAAEQH